MDHISRTLILVVLVLIPPALGACGGEVSQVLKSGTTEERLRVAMKALEEEDYLEAQQLFNAIILQDPASEYADDAQFHLAESYFRNEEYKLAAFNYNRLRTSFPGSPFQKLAFFRSGESYYFSSPTYDRDQRETQYAIDVFRSFVSIYSADSLTNMARSRIGELQEKLAQKDFMTAELYMKMEDYNSAALYYERVTDMYPDTEFAKRAAEAKVRAERLYQELRASTDRK